MRVQPRYAAVICAFSWLIFIAALIVVQPIGISISVVALYAFASVATGFVGFLILKKLTLIQSTHDSRFFFFSCVSAILFCFAGLTAILMVTGKTEILLLLQASSLLFGLTAARAYDGSRTR